MLPFSYNVKRIFSILLMAGFISFFIFFSASARELDNYLNRKEIIVIIGETKPLSVSNPRQVKIGNPDVLDVVGAGQKELLLSGKSEGETTLIVADDFGQYSYNVKIYKEDLEKVKERVDFLLEAAGFKDITTRIGDKERKIFLLGRLPISKKDFFESKLDSVRDKIINLVEYEEDTPSIEVDVEVLEIEKKALDNLGLTWNKFIQFAEPSSAAGTDFPVGDLLDPTQFFKIMKDWRTGTFSAKLNFLKEKKKLRILSRPKSICLSGKEAKLLIG